MARVSMPSTNQRLNFVINDFSGGLVNNVNDAKMLDNQSPDMLNMMFRNDGLLQKRPGTVVVGTTPLHDSLLDVIPYEYEANQHVMLYLMPTRLCTYDGTNFYTVWENNGLEIRYTHFMGELFFTDGAKLYSYNHKENKTYVYTNPPENFVPAEKPALNGVHKTDHIKAFVSYDLEGNEIPNSKPCLYYSKWYEPCQFEMEDGYKGANSLPPYMECITTHKDRLYITGGDVAPNMIWISDILNPSYYPASLPLQTPPDDDRVTALHVFNDALIIGRRDSIYAVFGNTNRGDSIEQFRMVKVNSHTGMPNNHSADCVYSMMFFAGSDGNFYRLNPPSANANTLSTSQINTLLDVTLPPFNLTASDVRYSRTIFDGTNNLWYIQIADITLVYNYQLRAWTRYNNINAIRFFELNSVIYFLRSTGCYYRFASKEGNQKYYDEYFDPDMLKTITLPVCAYWTSRNMDMGTPARVKQFRDTYVTSECFENYPTVVNIKYEVDYVDIQDTFSVINEISKWDKALFDVNKFITRNIDRSLPIMINRRGRTIKVFYGCGYEYFGSMPTLPAPGLVQEHLLVYARDENKLYLRIPRREGFVDKKDKYYREFTMEEMNQALLVHNVMGIYELKGYR